MDSPNDTIQFAIQYLYLSISIKLIEFPQKFASSGYPHTIGKKGGKHVQRTNTTLDDLYDTTFSKLYSLFFPFLSFIISLQKGDAI